MIVGLGIVLLTVLAVATRGWGGWGEGGATVDAEPVEPIVSVPPETIDGATPPETGVLRLGVTSTPGTALLRFGVREGLFAAEGLSVRLVGARDEAAIATALADGELDGAAVATEAAVAMRARGLDVRVILLLDQSTTADVILARSDIDQPARLVGQRVAYVPGSRGELLLRAALHEVGVGMDAIEGVAVVGEEPAALLERGVVDAAALSGPDVTRLLESPTEGAPEVGIAFASGDAPGVLAEVLVVREEVIADGPGQLLALVRGWSAGVELERDIDDELRHVALLDLLDGDQADNAARLEGTIFYDLAANAVDLLPGGRYYDVTVGRASEIALETGTIDEPVEPDVLLDGGFARAVASGRG